MAIPFPALLVLVGAGALVVARKKKAFMETLPVRHLDDAIWIRARMDRDQITEGEHDPMYLCLGGHDDQTVDILNNQANVQSHQVGSIVRKGDFITVSISQLGGDKNGYQDPFFYYPAIYVVAHAPNSPTVKKAGRPLLLDANLISGHGPKNWKIWGGKGSAPSKHSTVALRGTNDVPIFPEILKVSRKGKGTIFKNVLAERNGGQEWCLVGQYSPTAPFPPWA